MRSAPRRALPVVAALLLAPVLASCGSSGPPTVTVSVTGQKVTLEPTQWCGSGGLQRYDVKPPVIAAAPAQRITLTVPSSVAAAGWSVQVYDDTLKNEIGQVPVGKVTSFSGITTSDAAPKGYYLVVTQARDAACQDLPGGAWPVGFLRVDPEGTSSSTAGGSAAASG